MRHPQGKCSDCLSRAGMTRPTAPESQERLPLLGTDQKQGSCKRRQANTIKPLRRNTAQLPRGPRNESTHAHKDARRDGACSPGGPGREWVGHEGRRRGSASAERRKSLSPGRTRLSQPGKASPGPRGWALHAGPTGCSSI